MIPPTLKRFYKDPDATKDYSLDWRSFLEDGNVIFSSTWTVPGGITKVTDSHSSNITQVVLSGGTAGQTYQVTNRIQWVTASGTLQEERSILIDVQQQ